MKFLDNNSAIFLALSMSMIVAQVSENKFWFALKVGSSLVVSALCVIVLYLVQNWYWKESVLLNLFTLVAGPFLLFKLEDVVDKSVDEQQSYFANKTKQTQDYISEAAVKFFAGEDFWEASYGTNKTRLAELKVPTSYEDGYQVPVVCASPSTLSATDKEEGLPVIFYFFMGGLILGSAKTELPLIRWLANEANAVVVGVEYRKAPKYPYPIPLRDALEAAVGILEKKLSLEDALKTKINVDRIAAWGMSAGGYQAGHLSRGLAEKGYKLKCQVSFVPMAKPYGGTKSILKNWNAFTWSGINNSCSWTAFLPEDDGTLAADWRVSLLASPPPAIIKNLPPTLVQIHTRDVLRDEGEMYANVLKEQGKLIRLEEYDTNHAGCLPGISNRGVADGSMPRAMKILKEHLAR